jgi:long-chain acyl-CoA synthetase
MPVKSEATRSGEDRPDTFPKWLHYQAERHGDRHAVREKEFGIWQAWTWRRYRDEIHALACGLAALGMNRGDRLAIIGDNRPRLYGAMCAAQCLGAIPVPMYQDSTAQELAYVVQHAEARFAIAENQEQVDKLLELKADCPTLAYIIYDDERGLRNYEQDFVLGYERVQETGREYQRSQPEFLDEQVAAGSGSDTAIILYTSGTTGRPKGVILSHDNVLITARNAAELDRLRPDDEVLAYLPMAWVGDNIFSFGQSFVTGFCVSCPESSDTVLQDMNEIGPTFFFAPPRIFENLLTSVMIRMEDASWLKRKLFHYFLDLARRVGVQVLEGRSVGVADRLLYALGEVLIYGPLKNALGLSRVRVAYTAGEAIGPEIFDFYRSLGINIKQLYGQTEASVFITMQPDGEVKADTVGRPAPEVEIRIDDSGEVLYRSPGVFQSYYKNPDATAETKTEDGWVHTGDAGVFDEDGHLKIIDRAKDVGRLTDGTLFAPKYLENKLKFFPEIKEAVTFGDGRDYVAAFLNIDLEAVGSWAERNNVAYASYQELASNPDVVAMMRSCIEKVNADLAADEALGGSQIKRFLLLHKELDADDGELTRTRKVRRSTVSERYQVFIDALYSDSDSASIETEVTFEDGRTGVLRGEVSIEEAKTFQPVARAG